MKSLRHGPGPADEGIAAARRDAAIEDGSAIRDELQTWETQMLLKMEQYTHSAGRDMIRAELANRGLNRLGHWVGFDEAERCWCLTDSTLERA